MDRRPTAPDALPLTARPWRLLVFDYGAPLLAVIFFSVYAIPFINDGADGDWITCYMRAARRMQAHEAIHHVEPGAYSYPPAMAMLAMPLAGASPNVSLAAWYVVNVVAAVAAFICAWRLAGGPSLLHMPPRWHVVFWIGMILALRFFVAPLENQQFDMVIAAVLLFGCLQLWRGRDLTAGVWLGVAAAMKCTPLLFGPYLLWRGKFKAALLLGAAAVGLNLLPDLFWPQASGRWYVADWSQTFLANVGREAPGVWFSDILLNQSLAGMFHRFAEWGLVTNLDAALLTGAAEPNASVLRLLVYGGGGLLLAVTALRYGRPLKSAPIVPRWTPSAVALEKLQTGVEAAGVVCLMLLMSPMSSKAHYVVLLLPALMFARAAAERPSPGRMVLLGLLLVTGPLTAKGLIGKSLGDLTLAWGLPTWYALLLLAGMWMLHAEVRPAEASAVDEVPADRLRAA